VFDKSIVLFLLALLFVMTGCGASQKERRSPETRFIGINHPVQESWKARLAITDSGSRTGVIEAGHGAIYRTNTGDEHHLDGGIRVTFFDVNGLPSTSITAEKAVIHDNQDIEASGNVVITSAVTTVIRTEYVKRTAKDRMIRSDKFVTITRPGEAIRGYGFESDQGVKKYRIFKGSGEAFIQQ